MNDTPLPTDPSDDKKIENPNEKASFLDTILADAKLESAIAPTEPFSPAPSENIPPEKEAPKKERKPMDAATFFRLTGAILLVTLIFFGSFLAYIVFNPDQALFFLGFGINLNDVKVLLAGLVNSIFGFVIIVLSIVWVILLFRAIWTPRTLKKKKTLSIIGAIFSGLILFSLITLWAVLIGRINATDYENLAGSIVLYDNDLYKTSLFTGEARLDDTQTIIGPITIFFDISANAKKIAGRDLVNITRYDMNFDGAICTNGLSRVGGTDPTDQTIICTFDAVKEYTLEGSYETEDRLTGAKGVVSMELPPIKIVGLVAKSNTKNIEGKSIYTLDASSLRSFGIPNWILSDGPDPENPFVGGTRKAEASVTEVVDQEKKSFCLTFEGGSNCRIFVIEDVQSGIGQGSIRTVQDQTNPLSFTFEVVDLGVDTKELTDIQWVINGNTRICNTQASLVCEHTFASYGSYTLSVFITNVNGERQELRSVFQADELIELQRHVSVTGENGSTLNTSSTYDRDLGAYVIPGLTVPSQITLDARDILSTDTSYALDSVHWIISEGNTLTEKTGSRISVNITQEGRYEILGQYTFIKQGLTASGQTKTGGDKIILDVGREQLRPILLVYNHSDYVPVTITFDASPSEIQNGEIIKFIYDFGEGRTPVEGDAIQSYEYITAGEKKVTLTIVSTTGEKSSTTETIILKDQQKQVVLSPSIDRGIVGNPVDWNVNGTIGNIEQTIWNFGDGSAISYDREPTHVYNTAGTYTTTLKVRFTDGTVQEETYEFTVE